jgi:hypothetical protein
MVIIQQRTYSSSATCQRGHVEKVEDPCYVLGKCWNLLSKYNNFRFFLLQNMATLDHFSFHFVSPGSDEILPKKAGFSCLDF